LGGGWAKRELTVVYHDVWDADILFHFFENALDGLGLGEVDFDVHFCGCVLGGVGAARGESDFVAACFKGRGEVGADVGAGA
jgi:hypothetical protein